MIKSTKAQPVFDKKMLRRKGRQKKLDKADYIILAILTIYAVMIIYPFYNAFLISISTEQAYLANAFMLWPKEFSDEAYQTVFTSELLLSGYLITIYRVVLGVAINLLFTVLAGYVLSRDSFFGKNFVMNLIIVTIFFGGGLIPYYNLILSLGLKNSPLVLILPGAIDTFNMLLVRNYFYSIPKELEEAAKIDGANDFQTLFRIFVPVAMPVIATVGLFYAVGHWNEWFNSFLFIDEQSLKPLQLVLREIIVDTTSSLGPTPSGKPSFTEGVKMASIYFTMLPIMLVYPFVQKHFVRGIMVGAIKG